MKKIFICLLLLSSISPIQKIVSQSSDKKTVPFSKKSFSGIGEGSVIIGSEKGNFASSDIAIMDVAIDGNEYLFFITYERVYKIKSNGNILLVKPIKIGQGPGEFQHRPSDIVCDPQGNVYIHDGYKVVSFDGNLNFKRNINIPMLPGYGFIVGKSGFLYTMQTDARANNSNLYLAKLDGSGALIHRFSLNIRNLQIYLGGITLFLNHPYSTRALYCLNEEGGIFFAESNQYRLKKIDPEENLLLEIRVKENPEKVSAKEEEIIKRRINKVRVGGAPLQYNLEIPSYRPYMKAILYDGFRKLYIIKTKSVLDESKDEMIDVFDEDGIFLYRWEVPFLPVIIKKNVFYFYESQDNEPVRLKSIIIN